jgi:hypothetical protein
MQSANTKQFEPVQHIIWQEPGSPPFIAHSWKHARSVAHSGSKRHDCVSSQQCPTTHWLHGVPPGSSVQLPASIGGVPQVFPLHVRPTQHWFGDVHVEPGGRHVPVPQVLFWQTLLQHSLGAPHGKPSTLHCPPPQRPASHTNEQHSSGEKQPKPSGVHISKPHVDEFGLQKPVQQS